MNSNITSSLIRSYKRAIKVKEERGWEKIYILVDLHGTVIHPNWSDTELPEEYYEGSIEVLQFLSQESDVCLILWTSSHERDYSVYRERLSYLGVNFEYVNSNPEVKTDPIGYGNFDLKPYFNVIFDDKAGFEPEDWTSFRTLFEV